MVCSSRVFALTLLVLAASTACEEKSASNSASESRDAGASQVEGKVEGKLEKALANAVKASASESPSSDKSGPPADGIMDPVRADAEAKSGAPPTMTLGNDGGGPKFRLRSVKASLPKRLALEMTIQGGAEQGLPPIEMVLALESKPPREHDAANGSQKVTARVREVRMSMPDLPKEFTEQLKGLKGGKIEFTLSAEGAGYGFTSELSAGAAPQLKDLLDAGAEGLALMTLPVPTVPVGVGAVWMVASRDSAAGFGLVSYRMVKLTSVTEKTAELEFDARRYAVGRALDPAILPPGGPAGELRELSAGAKAHFQLAADSALATQMDGETALRGTIAPPGAPRTAPGPNGQPTGQRMLQSATGYRIKALP